MDELLKCPECGEKNMHIVKDLFESTEDLDVFDIVCSQCGFIVWGQIEG